MSDDASARLGLPYLAAGQMQKHVTLNEALTRLDVLVAPTVVSRAIADPPPAPVDGALYIRPAGATSGAWAFSAVGDLLRHEAGAWSAVVVPDGIIVYVLDEQRLVIRQADDWTPLGSRLGEVQEAERFGLNATADAANPFTARLDKALWTSREVADGGGDLRFTFNKSGPSAVLSLLMQSAYGGRAELGLIGSDDLSLKVSADGVAWSEVFSVAGATGQAQFAAGVARVEASVLIASAVYQPPVWARFLRIVACAGGGGGGSGAAGPTGTSRFGGGGGGAGGRVVGEWPITAISGPLTVTIGAGGTGGVAVGGTQSGVAGGAGGVTEVRRGGVALLRTTGGFAGGGGTTTLGAAGGGGHGTTRGNAGGGGGVDTNGVSGDQTTRADGPGGGGGGGGRDAAGTARSGGNGGAGHSVGDGAARGIGGSGGAPGLAGADGQVPANSDFAWAGGGGGGGGGSATGAGGAGGSGRAGGGGGGGGTGRETAVSGAGGAGGAGWVHILAIG